ncbi:helix-turn-helix domain-containing protein [Streptomyces sp. AV19]|uniref:helix-turn-helix domain-containing protein n=1 Tax=Streptomyces sp. AV19 TaxID=2793068 RepID=UPI0018FE5F7D|nr:helix-turn-helix transcriptional regulator [Streptomyces sp. AV19]MBH1933443.1 helix-turn-helix domain-containing protein [Streptomyces sp. AV19]MDG4532092.1 helix-turn-helix transcriptional regulator [Streptomyces sp. AV19]
MPAPKKPRSEKGLTYSLGPLIRLLRVQQGLTQAELGRQVGLSNSAISKFETGEKVPPPDITLRLDMALRAKGQLVNEAGRPGGRQARKYCALEVRASAIRHITEFIPAVLQTEAYIREFLRRGLKFYGGGPEEKVRYRLARTELLNRSDAPRFSTVIGESALRTRIGGPHIMREQLSRLITASARQNVDIRIVPFDGNGFFVRNASITIMTLPRERTIVYRDDPILPSYVTNTDDVASYISLYEHLYRDALPEDASITLIRKVLEEDYGGHAA